MSGGYEYVDHTADIQVHSWGGSLEESFKNAAYGMYEYMTDRCNYSQDIMFTVTVTGEDERDLLHTFLDELLFRFSTPPYLVAARITFTQFNSNTLTAECYGDSFDPGRHQCRTEVKAITRSNLQVNINSKTNDIYVILDI